VLEEELIHLARIIQGVRLGPAIVEPGQPVLVKLMPPTWELTSLDIASIADGLKIPVDLLRVIPTGFTGGITGALSYTLEGTLTGGVVPSLPIDIPVRMPIKVPLTIQVEWIGYGPNKTELTPAEFVKLDHINAPTEAAFVFIPPIIELTNEFEIDDPFLRPISRSIGARVLLDTGIPKDPSDLSKGTINSGWIEIPPVQFQILPLGVPTLCAFFIHESFSPYKPEASKGKRLGAVLLVAPENSILKRLEDVQQILDTLLSLLPNLSFLKEFASFLIGLKILRDALISQPKKFFVSADEIKNLEHIKLLDVDTQREPYTGLGFHVAGADFGDDVQAHDVFSSMIMIGPPPILQRLTSTPEKKPPVFGRTREQPRRKVTYRLRFRAMQCYQHKNHGGGRMDVHIQQELFAVIKTLHKISINNSITVHASTPEDRVTVETELDDRPNFGDILSSLKFGHQYLILNPDIDVLQPGRVYEPGPLGPGIDVGDLIALSHRRGAKPKIGRKPKPR
jgi:hypothetical protein